MNLVSPASISAGLALSAGGCGNGASSRTLGFGTSPPSSLKAMIRFTEAVDEFDPPPAMPQIDPDTRRIDRGDVDETSPGAEGHGRPAVSANPRGIDHLWSGIPISTLGKA